jgi:tRNA threonylcarbamoyladenosine biosynthesis protein TsaE
MKEMVYAVNTPEEFAPVISDILLRAQEILDQSVVIALMGDLGAGKTTFTQHLAKQVGVEEVVTSPTFGIMKRYELLGNKYFDQLVHIDAYRIENINEAGPLRLEDLFKSPRTLICIEWPENIADILPAEKIEVVIEIGIGEERKVVVKN